MAQDTDDELTLDNVPRSVDIEKGDLLVTSGLGGRFVEGYPVAVVQSVSRDGSNYFATVKAKPLAEFRSFTLFTSTLAEQSGYVESEIHVAGRSTSS